MGQSCKDNWQDDFLGYLGAVSSLSGFAGVILFGYQCLRWLIDGFWTPFGVGTTLGVSANAIRWQGLKFIVEWLLDQSLALALIVVPFVLFVGVISLFDHFARKH